MIKAILLLVAILLFRAMLPRRQRRTNTTITPYGSVFDVPVPAELACSELWLVQQSAGKRGGLRGRHAMKVFTTENTESTD
jgi:hypothetical protein